MQASWCRFGGSQECVFFFFPLPTLALCSTPPTNDDDDEKARPRSFSSRCATPLPLWSMPCSSHVTSQNLAPIWLPHWPAWRATISRMLKRKKRKGSRRPRKEGKVWERSCFFSLFLQEHKTKNFAFSACFCFRSRAPEADTARESACRRASHERARTEAFSRAAARASALSSLRTKEKEKLNGSPERFQRQQQLPRRRARGRRGEAGPAHAASGQETRRIQRRRRGAGGREDADSRVRVFFLFFDWQFTTCR